MKFLNGSSPYLRWFKGLNTSFLPEEYAMKSKKLLVYSLSVTVLLLLSSGQGGAKSFEEHSKATQGGLIVSSAVASAPYFVSKMIYALGGSLTAGGINLFSLGFAQETATKVGTQAVNGDWIVYPAILTRERSLQFIGTDEPVTYPTVTMLQEG